MQKKSTRKKTSEKIIHIHQSKTGGTWLNTILPKYLKNDYIAMPTAYNIASQVWKYGDAGARLNLSRKHLNDIYHSPEFHDVTKVSICRNPFDYLVSRYHQDGFQGTFHPLEKYSIPGVPAGMDSANVVHKIGSFDEYIKKYCDPDFPFVDPDTRTFFFHTMFQVDGSCGVDIIIRNEMLNSAVGKIVSLHSRFRGKEEEVRQEILQESIINASPAREKKDYRSYYTDELRELVEKKCDAELMLFEYDFDGPINDYEFINPDGLFYHVMTLTAMKNVNPTMKSDIQEGIVRAMDMIFNGPDGIDQEGLKMLMAAHHHITPNVFLPYDSNTLVWNVGNDWNDNPIWKMLPSQVRVSGVGLKRWGVTDEEIAQAKASNNGDVLALLRAAKNRNP